MTSAAEMATWIGSFKRPVLKCCSLNRALLAVRNAVKRGKRQVVHSTLVDAGVLTKTLRAVGLFDVIEHIQNDYGLLARTSQLMIPSGTIYITVPITNGSSRR